MLKKIKDALIGIIIALVAGYFYVVLRALLSAPRTNATSSRIGLSVQPHCPGSRFRPAGSTCSSARTKVK
jgi:hypothetical protein